MTPNSSDFGRRDVFLTLLIVLALFSLVSLGSGGFDRAVSFTDRDNKTFEDFQEYYLPAAEVIMKHPRPLGGYFYTPTFAIFLHFLVGGKGERALVVWQMFQYLWLILLLLLPAWFLAKISGRKLNFYLYLIAYLTSFPVFHNLKWGQVSLMITFLMLSAVMLWYYRFNRLAATILALATLIKYYPAFLLAPFLFKKDFKFLAVYTITILIAGLFLPSVFLGLWTTTEFYRLSLAEMSDALDWVAGDVNSQYFAHVFLRIFGINPDLKGFISLAGLILTAIILFKAYKAEQQSHNQTVTLENYLTVFLLLPFLLNTSWPHYFAWLPFAGVYAICRAPQSKLKILSLVALIIQSIAFAAIFPSYREYAFSGFLLIANLLILANLLLIRGKPNTPGFQPCDRKPEGV